MTLSSMMFMVMECGEFSIVIQSLSYYRFQMLRLGWDISQNGAVVTRSPPYTNGLTKIEEELCLPQGDYVFTIYDVYQDGMCCKWGEGSYSVTITNLAVIKEGGEFGSLTNIFMDSN